VETARLVDRTDPRGHVQQHHDDTDPRENVFLSFVQAAEYPMATPGLRKERLSW
jgi:hypothetical protein